MKICNQIHLMFVHKRLKQGSHIDFSVFESVVVTKGKSYFVNVGFFCVDIGFTKYQFPIKEVLPNV
jgi:hypothetical protein